MPLRPGAVEALADPLMLSDSLSPLVVRSPQFVIVARLNRQKSSDLLLAAFAWIYALVPEERLVVMGYGPLRDELGELSLRLGIAHRVSFQWHVSRPIEYVGTAEVFVLPSRFEVMPNSLLEAMNSLLEAMASGLPAYCHKCLARAVGARYRR